MNRTKKGTVTSEARQKYGDKKGRFPIFDKISAEDALKLRGHAKDKNERRSIIRRAARYAPAKAKAALQTDQEKGLI